MTQNKVKKFLKIKHAWEQRKFYDCFKLLRNNSLARAELAKIGKIRNIHYGDVLINYPEVLNISTATVPFIAESRVNSISKDSYDQLKPLIQGIKVSSISKKALGVTRVCFAKDLDEQAQIGGFFNGLEMLITLHQRE